MLTILEQISENILTAIDGLPLHADDPYNGDYITAVRGTNEEKISHLKAIIHEMEQHDDDDQPTQYEQWWQDYEVNVYVLPAGDDYTPIGTYNNAIAGAIHVKLMQDPTRGGFAINTKIKPSKQINPFNSDTSGLEFNLSVQYRHQLDNPFAQ